MKYIVVSFLSLCLFGNLYAQKKNSNADIIQIAYTSDVHYGLFKKHFEGKDSVSSAEVNKVLLEKINKLPTQVLPNDDGVAKGKKVDYIDDLVVSGDLANRAEKQIQSATDSWQQFEDNYLKSLTTKGLEGKPTVVLLTPGNHDASNAIGYYKKLSPPTNAISMVNIYNLMLQPATPKTVTDFDYYRDAVNYSRNIRGVHFVFVGLWPDSATRIWMEKDLATVSKKTPVVVFAHVPPAGDPKLFFNPNNPPTINKTDKFENLLSEKFKDSTAIGKDMPAIIEQRGFIAFLQKYPNIKAYFHGHENYNEFYDYTGLNKEVSLPTFRVDSPLKGKYSSKDESKLSFQLISIDPTKQLLTVRECLWNTDQKTDGPIVWGKSKTISLKVQ